MNGLCRTNPLYGDIAWMNVQSVLKLKEEQVGLPKRKEKK